ncbi:gamma-carboxygeranoyl-CoA hydratase [Pseudomonas sp. DC3000-4b1]|uniref:gamma-carboxygeranoyl-CoA hydratase n=1 Tax=unclassified Pseudomonas TaxID=196821 RepID=UPI003CF6F11E
MTTVHSVNMERDPRGFATLWLDRAEKNNAFDAPMITELTQALAQVENEPGLRFILLRGRGRHFSAGADLAWMRASAQLSRQANLDDAQALAELMYRLAGLPIPTLAVVQGAAFGGAVGLVSCCDMAIGAEDALFSLSEVRIGLIPAVISPFVVKALGERQARRYMLSAERFSAADAQALGLLHELAPAAELDALVERWVSNLLQNSPAALRACKGLLAKVGGALPDAQVRRYTEGLIADIRTSAEGQEGLAAFLEKRSPAWLETTP